MDTLELGYSPCPNDTFIFHALTRDLLDTGGLVFHERLEDVETLNSMALSGQLDVTKVSFGVITQVLDDYCLLRSGGALGRGCGPLVVSKGGESPFSSGSIKALRGKKIAIPGVNTTAYLLLRLFDPALGENAVPMAFDLIMDAVKEGEVDAGLIIHEGRFTYKDHGLSELIDLGQWWEQLTGKPIPLGGIIAKRSLGRETLIKIEVLINKSLSYALKHPEASVEYIKEHSQELSETVIRDHIGLYVNDFSLELGPEGEGAVQELLSMASERGLMQGGAGSLFIK
jgi:1,4-dihydroxy-6-naphthoate synthase